MLTLYDIDCKTHISWSPNTIKSKLALAHKGLKPDAGYRLEWISYPDIAPLLQSKGVPKRPGSPTENWTLPAIDADGKTIMDSWDIAEYIEDNVTDGLSLFPEHSRPLARATYSLFWLRVARPVFPLLLPRVIDYLDDKGAEYFRRTREQAFGPISHDIYKDSARVEKMWTEARPGLQQVDAMLKDNTDGPYLLGNTRSYADLCIVAILEWFKIIYPDSYDRMVSEAPALGKLYDACEELL